MVGAFLTPTASADDGAQVPDAVIAWFHEQAAQEAAALEGVAESTVVVGAPAPQVQLSAPEYDIQAGAVVTGATTLDDAVRYDDRYCALVRLPAMNMMCVTHHDDDSIEFTDLGSNLGLLPGVTELPPGGIANLVPGVGMFGIDLAEGTVTALDEAAMASLPQGTADGAAFLTALGKHWAQLSAGEAGGGAADGAGGAPPQVLDLEPVVAVSADVADKSAEEGSIGAASEPATSSSPVPAIVGGGILLVIGVGFVVWFLRRPSKEPIAQ